MFLPPSSRGEIQKLERQQCPLVGPKFNVRLSHFPVRQGGQKRVAKCSLDLVDSSIGHVLNKEGCKQVEKKTDL